MARKPTVKSTEAAVLQFKEAFKERNLDRVMEMMTDDCVLETIRPGPFGDRLEGQALVREFIGRYFENTPKGNVETEEMFCVAGKCVAMSKSKWTNGDGSEGGSRGIDVYHVRDGKIAAKFAYSKG